MISFFVPGIPRQKGSFRVFRNKKTGAPIVAKDNEKTYHWESAVALAAQSARQLCGDPIPQGPMRVTLVFSMPRPKAHFTKKGLRAIAPHWVTRSPDCDKLARAVLDPLSGICYRDDAQVAELVVQKVYSGMVGLKVTVDTLGIPWEERT